MLWNLLLVLCPLFMGLMLQTTDIFTVRRRTGGALTYTGDPDSREALAARPRELRRAEGVMCVCCIGQNIHNNMWGSTSRLAQSCPPEGQQPRPEGQQL